MAITYDRDVRDAIWYATDAISNRLINDSMFIEKAKKSIGNLKDHCYNIDLDNARGLGEQKVWVKGKYTEYLDKTAERKAQNMVRKDVVQKALKHYNEKYYTEVCNMTTMQFEKFDTALRAMHGNLSIEIGGMDDDIAHIDVPLNYLKYFDIKMPTTDFCMSKRKDSNNWIEGLPAIKKIETYNDRVTKVTFIDGTFTKAVCSENDHFDLDVGITICCMKRMMGKDGNKHYNDIIRHAHKVIVENDKKREKEAKEKAERKMKMRKEELKKAAGRLKAKEEQIDIQAQAIVRAHCIIEDDHKEEGLI